MTDSKSQLKPDGLQWLALYLLVISVGINYADRGNLGVALSSMQSELHLTTKNLGLLSSGFFWTYALFQLAAGKLIDRWNVNWVYAAGFLVWSAATGATGAVSSLGAIFVLRLLLGAGESIAYPAYSKIICTSFPERLRGTANALIDAGSKLGPWLGVLLGEKMLGWFNWRGMFILIGAASLIWLLPWSLVAAKLPLRRIEKASAWAPSYRQIIGTRSVWGTCIGLFCGNYMWYFYLTWLPYYFERERHYQKSQLSFFASLPFLEVAAASLCFGLLGDSFVRRGKDPGRVRQTFLCLGLLGCCAFMLPAVLVKSEVLSNSFLGLASISLGAWSSNHWALTQRLAGSAAAGKWTGFQNCLGNFAGVVGAWLTGEVLAATHSFLNAFAIACAVLLVGVLGYWFVVGKPTPENWRNPLDKPGNPSYGRENQMASEFASNGQTSSA